MPENVIDADGETEELSELLEEVELIRVGLALAELQEDTLNDSEPEDDTLSLIVIIGLAEVDALLDLLSETVLLRDGVILKKLDKERVADAEPEAESV